MKIFCIDHKVHLQVDFNLGMKQQFILQLMSYLCIKWKYGGYRTGMCDAVITYHFFLYVRCFTHSHKHLKIIRKIHLRINHQTILTPSQIYFYSRNFPSLSFDQFCNTLIWHFVDRHTDNGSHGNLWLLSNI